MVHNRGDTAVRLSKSHPHHGFTLPSPHPHRAPPPVHRTSSRAGRSRSSRPCASRARRRTTICPCSTPRRSSGGERSRSRTEAAAMSAGTARWRCAPDRPLALRLASTAPRRWRIGSCSLPLPHGPWCSWWLERTPQRSTRPHRPPRLSGGRAARASRRYVRLVSE